MQVMKIHGNTPSGVEILVTIPKDGRNIKCWSAREVSNTLILGYFQLIHFKNVKRVEWVSLISLSLGSWLVTGRCCVCRS